MTTSLSVLIAHITQALMPLYHDSNAAQSAAWLLVQKITGLTKSRLVAMSEIVIDDGLVESILKELVDEHKPLQYVLGSVPFLDVTITVKQPVLIPRPETEWWCALVLDEIEPYVRRASPEKPFSILDLCTGSGCIALAIAAHFKQRALHVTAVDTSAQALLLARENATLNGPLSVSFIQSDLYSSLPDESFDLIVTNPPYISENEYASLDSSVRDWEDKSALVAPKDGYDLIERIVHSAPRYLRSDYDCAQLWCEIGAHQAKRTVELFKESGFVDVGVLIDQYGRDRVVRGVLSKHT